MPVYTSYFVVLLVQYGKKEQEVTGPSYDDKFEAEKELNLVREAQKSKEWIDLPWFSASSDAVVAAYVGDSSVGFY